MRRYEYSNKGLSLRYGFIFCVQINPGERGG